MENDIDDGTKFYFNKLKHIKSLSKKEEHDLLMKYHKNHDLIARNKLISSNLKYACKLASSYRDRGISYNDLISEANYGLIEAIDKFDFKKDVKLISYAKWWIIQKMQLAIDKRDKMPASDLPDDNLFNENDDTDECWENKSVVNSEFIAEEENNESENIALLNALFETLNTRERDIINMYFGRNEYDESTLEEIGKKYKLTKERVRQIIEKALLKMRSKSMLVENKFLAN